MKFNQKITITEDIASVFGIKQKTNSRLLVVTYEFVDYTIIDYGDGEYVFVLNNFDSRDNADMEFEIQILDPEAI